MHVSLEAGAGGSASLGLLDLSATTAATQTPQHHLRGTAPQHLHPVHTPAPPAPLLRYLAEQQEAAIDGLASMTLQQLGLGSSRALVTVDPHMPTLLAYEMMLREGVSGAAVVSKAGELIANLSISDLRCAAGTGCCCCCIQGFAKHNLQQGTA
jgi:hypothetical protein